MGSSSRRCCDVIVFILVHVFLFCFLVYLFGFLGLRGIFHGRSERGIGMKGVSGGLLNVPLFNELKMCTRQRLGLRSNSSG